MPLSVPIKGCPLVELHFAPEGEAERSLLKTEAKVSDHLRGDGEKWWEEEQEVEHS